MKIELNMNATQPTFEDGQYYWVKRAPYDVNQISVYPQWEPMRWDEPTARFRSPGSGWRRGVAECPDELAEIGGMIRRPAHAKS